MNPDNAILLLIAEQKQQIEALKAALAQMDAHVKELNAKPEPNN